MAKYALIDTAGQWTPILEGVISIEEKAKIGKILLDEYPLAGQVAFINLENNLPMVEMMGGELSINGAIAGGYYLMTQNNLSSISYVTSGFESILVAKKLNNNVTVSIPNSIIINILNNNVILSGIKYKLVDNNTRLSKKIAQAYCDKDAACGYIIESNLGEIIPIVYVKATDTLITETACGSASLSYYLLSGINRIKQPSGKYIYINQSLESYEITVSAKIISDTCNIR